MKSSHSIPPTRPTIAFVLQRTFLSVPLHGPAHRRKLRTSSCRVCCNACEDVTITKESSVSRFADRELRFVEPNIVNMGELSLEGDSQMPGDDEHTRGWQRVTETTFGVVRPALSFPL